MKVVYIAGPFRGQTPWETEQYARIAETAALFVWRLGFAVICPHTNTRYFDKAVPDHVLLEGCRELLSRCDAVLMLPGWVNSVGATQERAEAISRGIPLCYDPEMMKIVLG